MLVQTGVIEGAMLLCCPAADTCGTARTLRTLHSQQFEDCDGDDDETLQCLCHTCLLGCMGAQPLLSATSDVEMNEILSLGMCS